MQRTSQKKETWERHKEVSIDWKHYDESRLSECKRILDLTTVFHELDKSVQRKEFQLSRLTVLLLFKILFGLSYRSIANATSDLKIYHTLGMKRAPCYKTIQNSMEYLDTRFLSQINRLFLPQRVALGGVDSSGLKTHRKGAWIQIRFQKYQKKRDFKKTHIFVDLVSKKIINCLVTKRTSSDHKQLKKILKECDWIQVGIILTPRKAHGCPSRRKAAIIQQENNEGWKKKDQATMRFVVEAIFSGMKRRFGKYFFSIKNRFR